MAELLTAHERKVAKGKQAEALKQEIRVAHAACEADVKRLCKAYGWTKDHVESLLNHATNYMLTRRPSFYNALVHHLSKELNEGEQEIIH